jgi:hypothetical protein
MLLTLRAAFTLRDIAYRSWRLAMVEGAPMMLLCHLA